MDATKRIAHALLLGGVAIATATTGLAAPAADADPNPLDPHVPNITMNNCPGGRGGFGIFFCDGMPYPDGSYWHQVIGANSAVGDLQCVVPGGVSPAPAPPGSCGGGR